MAAGLLFVLIWSSAFTAARVVVLEWPPLWALALRFVIAAPLVAIVVMALRRLVVPSRADAVRLALMGAFGTGGYLGCAWIAMSTTPSGLVALLTAVTPLFVAVGERVFFGRRLGPRAWGGLGLGWAGVALLGASRAGQGIAAAELPGILLSLAGALSQAVGVLCFAPARGRVDAWTANLGQTLGAGAVLVALALVLNAPLPETMSRRAALGLMWSVVVVGLAGYALYFLMLRRLPLATASALQLLAPPVAALLGWALLGERLLLTDIAGGAVTLAGLALLFSARRG
jgi:drug/metabolite transporter (DMT)-like permease